VGGEGMNTRLAFIAARAHDHAICLLCRTLNVSRSWFHAWRRTTPDRAARTARYEALADAIRAIFEESKQRYGAPRIHAGLRDWGHRVSRKTVARLMKLNGIRPSRRKRRIPRTTDSRHSHGIAPNLLSRNFIITAPDTVWLADISCIPPGEGWLCLAAVKDPGTMEIVGRAMSERLKSTLCEDALNPFSDAAHRLPGNGWPFATGARQQA
jgi:transposase InsO family protein